MAWNHWGGEKTMCGRFELKVNEACLKVVSDLDVPLRFFTRNTECYECDYGLRGNLIAPNAVTPYVIDTQFGLDSYFARDDNITCQMTNQFDDFGVYSVNVSETGCSEVQVLTQPEKFWINIVLLVCIYMGCLALIKLSKFIYARTHFYFCSSSISIRELEMDLAGPNARSRSRWQARKRGRVTSIDAFRGLAILLMIFVNYGGGEYAAFKHTPWNGLTVADLVFPWFVWIMGASLALSLNARLRSSDSRGTVFYNILKRSALLIVLGVFLNSGHRDRTGFLRVAGVLQRLGVTYFFIASTELLFVKPQRNDNFGPWIYCQDVADAWTQWLVALILVAIHTGLTFGLDVPGCPVGYLGPGGLSNHSHQRNCTGGAAGYVDRLVLTPEHMYHRGSFVRIYEPPVPYDPEGLLGIFTCFLCASLGLQASRIILSHENSFSRIRKWLLWALMTGITAGFLCGWTKDEGPIPVNKNLWSLSYVLAASSAAFVVFAVLYWLIDVTQYWTGFPLVFPGMNAIALYLGHSLLKTQLPWRWVPFTNTHLELLVMDVSATTLWLAVAYLMYRRNVFITL